jgi:Methylamine utilisation protein MauE
VLRASVQTIAGGYATFLFIVALAKLDGWQVWSASVAEWLPAGLPVRAVCIVVPAIEAATAALLLLAPARGLLVAAALLGGFGGGVLVLGRRAQGKDCGCFGTLLPSRIGRGLAIRNLLLAALAAVTCLLAWQAEVPGLPAPAILLFALLGALLVLGSEVRSTTLMIRNPAPDEGGPG